MNSKPGVKLLEIDAGSCCRGRQSHNGVANSAKERLEGLKMFFGE